jgi:hypothetical protein
MHMDLGVTENHVDELNQALRACERALAGCREALASDRATRETYDLLVSKLRGMNTSDPDRVKSLPKELARFLNPIPSGMKHLLAVSGSAEGLAKLVMGHLGLFGLPEDQQFEAMLVGAKEDPERSLVGLAESSLRAEQLMPVLRIAFSMQSALDYEEYKKQEILEVSDGVQVAALRPGQLRGLRSQHLRRHALALLPKRLREEAPVFRLAMWMLLERDPFGTLEFLREEKLPDPMGAIPLAERMALLERTSAHGLGFASNYLDLFGVPDDPKFHPRLQGVFCSDLIGGSSIYGAYALEGAHRYPFGLGKVEPVLPRRVTSADALAFLGRDETEMEFLRNYRPAQIDEALARLQEQQILRFLENLKADLRRYWKSHYPEKKLETIFGDPELKIRNILYLVAHGTFKEADYFERLCAQLEDQFPAAAEDSLQIARLANRYFFLDLLGLNPGLLFAAPQRGSAKKSLIEEVGDFQIRSFLHAGMSIHLRLGDQFFKAMPIAWNMLVNQYEGPGQVMQELTFLLEAFDTLLTLSESAVPDPAGWLGPLVDALIQGNEEMPELLATGPPKAPLRITTRETVDRYRGLLNAYCLQMIQANVKRLGLSTSTVIQNLRLPRNRTDKLFALLEGHRQKARETGLRGKS